MIDKFVDAYLMEVRLEAKDDAPRRNFKPPNVYVGRDQTAAKACQRAAEAFLDANPELEADVEPDVRSAWMERAYNEYGWSAPVWERDKTFVPCDCVNGRLEYDERVPTFKQVVVIFEFDILVVDDEDENSIAEGSNWLSRRLQDYEGYTGFWAGDETSFVAVADWNHVPEGLCALSLALGFDIEWCDGVKVCDGCQGIVQTQPDSYGWTPRFKEYDDGSNLFCEECVLSDLYEYEEHLKNEERVDTLNVEWAARGWQKLEYEADSGLYRQNRCNKPGEIIERLCENFDVDVLFGDFWTGQFESGWSIYVRHPERPAFHDDELEPVGSSEFDFSDEELEEMVAVLEGTERVGHKAKMADAALKSIPIGRSEEGVVYSKVDTETGKVETRIVSKEEFVKGIKG